MFANTKKFIAPLAALLVAYMAVEAVPVLQNDDTFIQTCACHNTDNDVVHTQEICTLVSEVAFYGVPGVGINGTTHPTSFDGTSCLITFAGQADFIAAYCDKTEHGTTVCTAL
ncbi:hypothetical protein BGZ99_007677 [Dissophora globulifera]|uniref:Uncharacterized protein n=1 Tax=Dissophora globulifera TaxID=979702 RepID=A0A9P6UQF7_9FUNG|nr:hypothetical protein BGZ99_007677 [Dissophora globulifera]